MNLRNKWTMGLLTLGAVAVIGLSAGAVYAQSATATPDQTPAASVPQGSGPQGSDQQRPGARQDNSAILADVLGLTTDQLQAAVVKARDAAIDQALASGKITQEQADQMKSNDGMRGPDWGPGLGAGADHDAELAAALGITEDALKAAKAEVNKRVLAADVADGKITQEEADLMTAQQALADYVKEPMETAYKTAVAQAVTAGVITQDQADKILSENGGYPFGPGMGGPRPGRGPGGHHGGPLGGPNGGPAQNPGQAPSNSPIQPDSTSTPQQ
jgi:hypothetical protein